MVYVTGIQFCCLLPHRKTFATKAVAADVGSVEGRQKVQQRVAELCQGELICVEKMFFMQLACPPICYCTSLYFGLSVLFPSDKLMTEWRF